MNRAIDITDNHILQTGPLPKTGGEFQLVLLQTKDIGQMLALQELAFAALPPEQQNFLHHKTPEFLARHLKNPNNAVLGVVHDGQLVAQSVVVNPTPYHPHTGMTDLKMDVPAWKTSVIQGVIVDPEYRGNKLMTAMVDEWLAIAKQQKRTHALAEVTIENHHSWSVFMKEGLHIHSLGHDNTDGANIYNMHASVTQLIKKRARPDFNKVAKKCAQCKMTQILPQKALLNKGYVGVSFDAANHNISFQAPRARKKPQHGQQAP